MKINIIKCLEFLDNPSVRGHASAIVGMIGEELNACAFKHYIDNNGGKAKILCDDNSKPLCVTPGTSKGKRLDRWIEVDKGGNKTLFQCEIKNWSATAIGGKFLAVDADEEETKKVTNNYWSHQMKTEFSNEKYPSGVTKVFGKMKLPKEYSKTQPLLIYWMPISKSDRLDPFFNVSIKSFNNSAIKTEFEKLHIFSVSLYFRKLLKNKIKTINFDMPASEYRIGILKSMGFL